MNKIRRGEDFFKNFEAVLLYAKNKNVDMVVHGGDLFYRSKVPIPIVDRVYQTLSAFTDNEIPVYIVPGNHERSRLPISLFLNHTFIHTFDRPKIYPLKKKYIRIIIGGFPFIRKNVNSEFLSIMSQSGWTTECADIKILVFHQAIEGAAVGPKNYTFRNSEDVIPLSLLPNDANIVLCGHIHRQQKLVKFTQGNIPPIPVILSGSTERTSFAEKDEEKGFFHLKFISDKNQNWHLDLAKFIELPTRPMKYIDIDPDLDTSRLMEFLKKEVDQIDKNAIIKFRSHKPIQTDLALIMTNTNLRHLLPSGISFGFSSNFFNSHF
jgi:DNA repair exonuclease SbcCD nuclease subunit